MAFIYPCMADSYVRAPYCNLISVTNCKLASSIIFIYNWFTPLKKRKSGDGEKYEKLIWFHFVIDKVLPERFFFFFRVFSHQLENDPYIYCVQIDQVKIALQEVNWSQMLSDRNSESLWIARLSETGQNF